MMTFNWKDKNVFITGATGWVGSWLTKFLVDEGANDIESGSA
jgi:nucleoside-diphosphate-sugar epimerase